MEATSCDDIGNGYGDDCTKKAKNGDGSGGEKKYLLLNQLLSNGKSRGEGTIQIITKIKKVQK